MILTNFDPKLRITRRQVSIPGLDYKRLPMTLFQHHQKFSKSRRFVSRCYRIREIFIPFIKVAGAESYDTWAFVCFR